MDKKSIITTVLLILIGILLAISGYLYFRKPEKDISELSKYKEKIYLEKIRGIDSVRELFHRDTLRLSSKVEKLNYKLIQANQELIKLKFGFDKDVESIPDKSAIDIKNFLVSRYKTNDILVEENHLIVGDTSSRRIVSDVFRSDYYYTTNKVLDSIVAGQKQVIASNDSIKKLNERDMTLLGAKLTETIFVKDGCSEDLERERAKTNHEKKKNLWTKISAVALIILILVVAK